MIKQTTEEQREKYDYYAVPIINQTTTTTVYYLETLTLLAYEAVV